MKTFLAGAVTSNTVWWSVAQVAVGLILAFCAKWGYLSSDWSGYGWTLISAGLLVGGGRVLQGSTLPFATETTGDSKTTTKTVSSETTAKKKAG